MNPARRPVLWGKFLVLFVALAAWLPGAEDKARGTWEKVTTGSVAIAVPKEWRNFDGLEAGVQIFRQGDGRAGVPALDETGAPLQMGVTVEKLLAQKKSIDEIAKDILREAIDHPALKQLGPEKLEPVVLSDGTKATLLTTEFAKRPNRHSFYLKLVAKTTEGEVWVATGFIVGGRDSTWPSPKSALAAWLRAHVVSLTVQGKDIDPAPLELAYKNLVRALAP